MSYDEWSAIPEIGDYTIKHRNRKTESNSAVPDSVLGAPLPCAPSHYDRAVFA